MLHESTWVTHQAPARGTTIVLLIATRRLALVAICAPHTRTSLGLDPSEVDATSAALLLGARTEGQAVELLTRVNGCPSIWEGAHCPLHVYLQVELDVVLPWHHLTDARVWRRRAFPAGSSILLRTEFWSDGADALASRGDAALAALAVDELADALARQLLDECGPVAR